MQLKKQRILRMAGTWLLLMLLLVGMLPASAYAAEKGREDESTVDFVLVLDCSGTMKDNDPKGWTASAAKTFVDLLGVEKSRLAIVAFGPYYGEDSYPVGQGEPDSRGRVKVSYKLQDVSEASAKTAAKKAIQDSIDAKGTDKKKYGEKTPIGYALNAATAILKEGKAKKDQAAIILLSDGQVEGQTDFVDKSTKLDYKSINKACDEAASYNWPVYAMELNFQKENKASSGLPGIAYHQMRENIPGKTGTDPVEVTSVEKAVEKLQEIFAKYFNSEIDTGTVEVNGKASFDFDVEEMTAERTITLSGDISKLDSISLISPKGKTEEFKIAAGDQASADRRITFDKSSAVVKMIMPEEGEWQFVLKGNAKVKLDYAALSLREMNLKLTASDEEADTERGTAISFKASFVYNDITYESEAFFEANPAELYVNGEKAAQMESTSDGYEVTYSFDQVGSYEVYAQVDSSFFREGHKKSGVYEFDVDHVPTQLVNPDETLTVSTGVHASSEAVSLSEYFKNDTADHLNYSVEKNDIDEFQFDLSADGTITFTAGETSDTYQLSVIADDGTGEAGAELPVTLEVANKPVAIAQNKEIEETVSFVVNEQAEIDWSEYFTDPDGTAPEIRIDEKQNSGIAFEEMPESLLLSADKPGEATILAIAVDGNTQNSGVYMTVHVQAVSALAAFVGRMKFVLIPLAIVLASGVILLVLLVTGRKIYGTWDIEGSDGLPITDRQLGKLKSGKKSKARLDRVLRDLGVETGFPKVELTAGNRFNKKVFLQNLEGCDYVEVNYIEIAQEDLPKAKINMTTGKRVLIQQGDTTVTLERVRTD